PRLRAVDLLRLLLVAHRLAPRVRNVLGQHLDRLGGRGRRDRGQGPRARHGPGRHVDRPGIHLRTGRVRGGARVRTAERARVGVGLAYSAGMLYAGLGLMAVGSALAMPCVSSLASRYAPADRQGLALGTNRSMMALARALGPVAAGAIYWKFGSTAAYLVAAA